MKKKILSVFLTLVLVLSFSLVTAVPVVAQDGVPDRVTAITNAADRLVATQSTAALGLLDPPDYGWDWKITVLTQHSENPSAHNMYGVVILGLLDAYGETEESSYLAAATGMANRMTDTLNGDATLGDFYKREGEEEHVGAYDYQFLMRYAGVSGNSDYGDYAIALWGWEKLNPESLQADLLEWAGDDPGAALWMLAAFAEAGRLIGDTTFATDCAGLIVDELNKSNGWLLGDYMTEAECLEFLSQLDSATYSSTIGGIITDLVEAQKADGCWDDGVAGTFQDTAYAVRALAVYGGTDGLNAARKGAAWLIANQLPNGGWLDDSAGSPIEYSEQDAEGLRALVATAAPVTIDEDGYYSIQQAIDSAGPGYTINVAAGTYAEQLIIDEEVTLDGANAGINAVTGERGDESIIDVSGFTGDGIKVTANNVTIDGFTIIGIPEAGSPSSNVNPTIAAEANYVTVQNCVFNTSGGVLGKEAMVARPGTNNISFLDNEVNNYMFGITARGSGWGGSATLPDDGVTYLTVSGNTFNVGYVDTGSGITGEAVQIHYGNDIVVTGNIINGPGTFESCTYDLINSIGITDFMSGYGAAGTITYSNNEVTNCYVGIGTFAGNGEISGNTVTGNNIGIQVGQNDDVYISTPAEGVAITGNDIQNNIRGIWAQNFVVDGLAANYNNIVGNTEYGVINEDPENDVFDATNNWWGDLSGPTHASNPGGSGDAVSDNVLYEPWLAYEVGSTTGSDLDLIAQYSVPPLQIGISVEPALVNFGDVEPGVAAPGNESVTVTNTGNVAEDFSASIKNESPEGVYSAPFPDGLTIGPTGSLVHVTVWEETNVPAGEPKVEDLVLTVPSGTAPSTYTATLVFWAEAAE